MLRTFVCIDQIVTFHMNLTRIILLLPLSMIYGFVMFIRNLMFDWGILPSVSFSKPIISVGNLAAGGSGKTPMVVYLIEHFHSHNKQIAVLSRGYNRKSKGYKLVVAEGNPEEFGDEVMMLKYRFPDIRVAVAEKRVVGINQLLSSFPDLDVIILDDGFQHRYVKANCHVLLTDYNKPFWRDFVLPSGYLRESRSGCKRANIVVATKVRENEDSEKMEIQKTKISEKYDKPLYFMRIEYNVLKSIAGQSFTDDLKDYSVLLFTGIDNPVSLTDYINDISKKVIALNFRDHHWFSGTDINKIRSEFSKLPGNKKIIITTEKDFSRIKNSGIEKKIHDLPLYYISIRLKFMDEQSKSEFNQKINDYVGKD